jgi:hypothetical protein
LRVQLPAQPDVAKLLDRLVAEVIANQNGLAAWQAFIHAHATLMRQLATDLVDDIGLTWATSTSWHSSARRADNCASASLRRRRTALARA